jgi:hypothetical protein
MKDGLTQTVGSRKQQGAASCAAEDVLAEILESTGCAYGEYWVRAELENDFVHPLGRKVSTRSGGGRPGGAFRFSMENVFGQLSPMMSLARVSRTGSDSGRESVPSQGGETPLQTPKGRNSISEKSPFASILPRSRNSIAEKSPFASVLPRSRNSISEKSPFASLFPGFRSSPGPVAL